LGTQRFKALVAGIQSGKTLGGSVWARMQFDTYPQDTGLICAPTYKILTQSTLPKFFELNPDLKKYYKKGDSEISVPNRGTIFIRSTENPNVLEGMTLRWAWADEAGQMKLEAWVNLQGRLSILQGQLFITSTPYTLNWLYTDFYEQFKLGNKDYLVVQFRSCDNPYFPQEEYDRVKATMDPRTFKRRYDGLFEKMEGLVYDLGTHLIIAPKEIQFKETIAGIDWGFNNPAAIAVLGIDYDNNFYLIDEYYRSGQTTQEIIAKLKEFSFKYNIRMYYPDPAEPDRLEEMRRAGLYPREVNKGKDSITNGIDRVRELIRRNQLKIFNTCRYALDEFATYHYPEGLKEDPIKEDDHLMDALRYAIYSYQPPPPIRRDYLPKNLTNPAR
jgi:PBSX family phage terminase large subunit